MLKGMRKRLNKRGVSLIEVLLSAVIFSLSVAGFFAAMSVSQTRTERNDGNLQTSVVAQAFLDDLRKDVDQSMIEAGTSRLTVGTDKTRPFVYNYQGTEYTYQIKYNVNDAGDGATQIEILQVTMQ